jgi:hypothetical protein
LAAACVDSWRRQPSTTGVTARPPLPAPAQPRAAHASQGGRGVVVGPGGAAPTSVPRLRAPMAWRRAVGRLTRLASHVPRMAPMAPLPRRWTARCMMNQPPSQGTAPLPSRVSNDEHRALACSSSQLAGPQTPVPSTQYLLLRCATQAFRLQHAGSAQPSDRLGQSSSLSAAFENCGCCELANSGSSHVRFPSTGLSRTCASCSFRLSLLMHAPAGWLLQLSAAVAPAGDAAAAPQWGVSTTTTRRAAAA